MFGAVFEIGCEWMDMFKEGGDLFAYESSLHDIENMTIIIYF